MKDIIIKKALVQRLWYNILKVKLMFDDKPAGFQQMYL